jgi:hypothetical protein
MFLFFGAQLALVLNKNKTTGGDCGNVRFWPHVNTQQWRWYRVRAAAATTYWKYRLLFLNHSLISNHCICIRSSNSHGWGGNYFMTGGSVKGKVYCGKVSRYLVARWPVEYWDGPLNIGRRGRLIPTTPWESPFNAIAKWMGVVDDNDNDGDHPSSSSNSGGGVKKKLDYVLPNRKSFPDLMGKDDFFV